MRTSRQGLQLIEECEGFVAELYNDRAGHCSIGFGCLVHKGPRNGSDPGEQPFAKGVSRAEAERLLAEHLTQVERALESLVKVPLNQNQFDALVDFVYNLGSGTLAHSTLLEKLNSGAYDAVPDEVRRFVYAGGKKLAGLERRREREAELWSRQAVASAAASPTGTQS